MPSAELPVLETRRLRLRPLVADDAWFILRLFNEPSFIEHIGDRGVRTPDQAHRYIQEGPRKSYAEHGLGLLAVEARRGSGSRAPAAGQISREDTDGEDSSETSDSASEHASPVGICGLVSRAGLPGPDLGFAFLPEFWSRGFAEESSRAVLEDCSRLGLARVLAITSQTNPASMRVLEKLGFHRDRMVILPGDEEELVLFALDLAPDGV